MYNLIFKKFTLSLCLSRFFFSLSDIYLKCLSRFKPGVPATLAKVSLKDKNCQASLFAYPCWSLQEEGTCSALQNVVDIYLDPQDILWVLDTGIVNSLEQSVRKCPPKVIALNVKTGKVR